VKIRETVVKNELKYEMCIECLPSYIYFFPYVFLSFFLSPSTNFNFISLPLKQTYQIASIPFTKSQAYVEINLPTTKGGHPLFFP
jgi:hypothetical protein